MIIKANLERKPSTLETEPCNIVGVEQVSLEEFLALKNKPLDDYPFIQKWAAAMGTGETGEHHCLLVLNDENDDGIVVNSSGYSYARYAAFVPGAKNTYLMELYPDLRDAVHELVALVEAYSNMAVERQCDGAFQQDFNEIESHPAFQNSVDELFVKMISTRPEISFTEYDGATYYFEIAPEYRIEEEPSTCRVLSQEEVDIMCAKHVLYLHDSGGEQANFSGCLLKNIDLHDRQLNGANFDGAELVGCNMQGMELCFGTLNGAAINNCNCSFMTAEEAQLCGCKVRNCSLFGSVFTHSDFSNAVFRDCNFCDASIRFSCLEGTDFGNVCTNNTDAYGCVYSFNEWDVGEEPAPTQSL